MKQSYKHNIVWKHNHLFEGISEKGMLHLEGHLISKTYEKGEYLIKVGTFGDAIFLIEKGKVVVQKDNIKLAEKTAGDYVGAMALLENTTRSADVIATEQTLVKVLTVNQLKAIQLDDMYQKVLANHIKEQQDVVRKMNDLTIQETKSKLHIAGIQLKNTRFYLFVISSLLIVLLLVFLLWFFNILSS